MYFQIFLFVEDPWKTSVNVTMAAKYSCAARDMLRHVSVIKLALMLSLGLWTASLAFTFSRSRSLSVSVSHCHCRHRRRRRRSHLPCVTSLNIAHTPRMAVRAGTRVNLWRILCLPISCQVSTQICFVVCVCVCVHQICSHCKSIAVRRPLHKAPLCHLC